MNKAKSLVSYLINAWFSIIIDRNSRLFIDFCKKRWTRIDNKRNTSVVLVELFPLDQTVLAFSYFANLLAQHSSSKIVSFSLSNRNQNLFCLRYRRFIKIYQSFNADKHVNTKIPGQPTPEATKILQIVKQRIKSKDDVLDIEINGDQIGNEIYEAYLREKLVPTVNIDSIEFEQFLILCINTYLFWSKYFEDNDVKGVILSHGIYRYGIIKILANRKGIPVYLPNIRTMYCLKNQDEWGLPKYKLYPSLFSSLPAEVQRDGILWAKNRLELRFGGAVGVDMSYSTASAFGKHYSSTRALAQSSRIKVLIATHCFFDNPNAYGRNLFPDFFEWIDFLGQISDVTDYDWYIKTHPDVLQGNDEVLDKLLVKYKNIKRLPSNTSHLQIIQDGVNFVLTVYGSVGHEYPLFGKTVINAGEKNPHIGYGFNIHATTIEAYRNYLLNLEKIQFKVPREQVYEFYFMHHGYSGYSDLFFQSFADFQSTLTADEQNSPLVYEYFKNDMASKGDRALEHTIRDFIVSGKYKYIGS